MAILGCAPLWYAYMSLSAFFIAAAIYYKGSNRNASLGALIGTALFAIIACFRDPVINSDTRAYIAYSNLAQETFSAFCYLIGTRFEPPHSLMIWGSANMGAGHLGYLLVVAALTIVTMGIVYWKAPERFLLFSALTFPQFGFMNDLATIRWGLALHAIAASMVLFDRRIIRRSIGAVVATSLHFGVAVAAATTIVKPWYLRIGLVVLATALIATWLPTGELASGSGLRYIVALALSAAVSAFAIPIMPRNANALAKHMAWAVPQAIADKPYRDHLTLVACAAIMSMLYFVSPHLTRFAVALLFISYVPLILSPSFVTRSRLAVLTLAVTPVLVLGLEVRTSSCTIWAQERTELNETQEVQAAVQYEQSDGLKKLIFGSFLKQCEIME